MDNNLQSYNLGFLDLIISEDKENSKDRSEKYFGAVLITDSTGVPLEFRCTHPIKPGIVQKQLYGKMLLPYVSVTLCGLPLLNSLNIKPSLLIVKKDWFLEIREKSDIPIVFIKTSGETSGELLDFQSTATADSADMLFSEIIDDRVGKLKPINLYVRNKYREDIRNNIENLKNIFYKIDPLEPFDRILKALEMISTQDERFR
ncbi:MAG: hypothetical protein KJ770_06880 [Actinobacteria bacterium]|nr:hypothetical protein [Actinomycetota bacterium]